MIWVPFWIVAIPWDFPNHQLYESRLCSSHTLWGSVLRYQNPPPKPLSRRDWGIREYLVSIPKDPLKGLASFFRSDLQKHTPGVIKTGSFTLTLGRIQSLILRAVDFFFGRSCKFWVRILGCLSSWRFRWMIKKQVVFLLKIHLRAMSKKNLVV